MKHEEFNLQKSLAAYLEKQYPAVLFLSDTIANVKLNVKQASRNKSIQKNEFKCPDLLILEPRGKYHGLFMELKIETPYRKDGQLKSCKHLSGQAKSMTQLNSKGYFCNFVWTYEQAKTLIDKYLALQHVGN